MRLPNLELLERLLVRDVVDDTAGVRATVEGGRQRLKAFLPGRVPDL